MSANSLLPESKSIKDRLQKLEESQKSFQKFLEEKDNQSNFDDATSYAKFTIDETLKPTPRRFSKKATPVKFNNYGLENSFTESCVESPDKLRDQLKQKDQEIANLKQRLKAQTICVKAKENSAAQNMLKHASRVECANCKWLICTSNFPTHLNFCQEKNSTDDTISDGMVRISTEQEPRIRHSISTEVFQDIGNTYEKSDSKKDNLIDYQRASASITNSPGLKLFPPSLTRKNSNLSPLNFHNKENKNLLGVDRYKNSSDSFINRVNQSNCGSTYNPTGTFEGEFTEDNQKEDE